MDPTPAPDPSAAGARDTDDDGCSAHEGVSRALAHAGNAAEAVPGVLQAIAQSFGWKLGVLWIPDEAGRLSCLELWRDDDCPAPAFERMTWQLHVDPGDVAELPARALAERAAVWCDDATRCSGRRDAAAAFDGVHAGLAVPLDGGAVAEFFGDAIRPRDDAVVEHVTLACAELGRFLQAQHLHRELGDATPTTIREEVVESLWLAQTALETGQVQQAARLVDASIDAAERIATEAQQFGTNRTPGRLRDV